MNESERTRGLMNLVYNQPDLCAFKHSDRFTVAIPDVSVTGYGITTWMEMKVPPQGTTLLNYVKERMDQLVMMMDLEKKGNAVYVIWNLKDGNLSMWSPDYLFRMIKGVTPTMTSKDGTSLKDWREMKYVMERSVGLHFPGPCYDQVIKYVRRPSAQE